MDMKNKWIGVCDSILGRSHIKNDMPNQDSLLIKYYDEAILFGVADGHGSRLCMYSDRGSEFALKALDDEFKKIKNNLYEDDKLNIKMLTKSFLNSVIESWKEYVLDDYKNIIKDELNDDDLYNILLKYGTTLVFSILIDEYIFTYQLGDGNILFISNNNDVITPIDIKEENSFNNTLSMCNKGAIDKFSYKIYCDINETISLILISTDGYFNSFETNADFEKVGIDILDIYKSEGIEYIKDNLNDWLKETSDNGSGDDTSVCVLIRNDIKNNNSENNESDELFEVVEEENIEIVGDNQLI